MNIHGLFIVYPLPIVYLLTTSLFSDEVHINSTIHIICTSCLKPNAPFHALFAVVE